MQVDWNVRDITMPTDTYDTVTYGDSMIILADLVEVKNLKKRQRDTPGFY